MTNIKLVNYSILENLKCEPYSSITYDGKHFYSCYNKANLIYRLDAYGYINKYIKTKNSYKLICYDSCERCFWAISSKDSQYVYKLDCSFCEIYGFLIKLPNCEFIKNISYKTSSDVILICSQNTVYEVSKQGKMINQYNFCKDYLISSIGDLDGNIIKCTSYLGQSPTIVNMILQNHCEENLNCLPSGHKDISLFSYSNRLKNSTIYIATVKNNKFSYLLEYKLINISNNKPHCECSSYNKEILNGEAYISCNLDQFTCIKDINIS